MGRIEYDYIVFEWDDNKNISNQEKHGLSFETALTIFFDSNCLTKMDFVQDGEQRWKTLGMLADTMVILFVGHVVFDDKLGREVVRIITARRATPHEEKSYYVGH